MKTDTFLMSIIFAVIGLGVGVVISVVILMAPLKPAAADFFDGYALQLYCTSQNPQDDAVCLVYITGSFDAFTTVDVIAQKTDNAVAQFCVPEGIGPDQLKDRVVAFMQRQDTNLEFAASLVVLGAIQDAYGCDH